MMRRIVLAGALAFSALLCAAQESPQVATPAPSPAPEVEFMPADPPPPAAPPASEIDMTAFQDAYDREMAEAQAEVAQANANETERAQSRADSAGLATLMAQSAVALLLICALIVLAGWVARKLGARTPLLAGTELGQVMGRVYLEPKHALHYVRSGGRVLVIGITPAGMSLLTEFEADAFEQPAGQPANPPAGDVSFGAHLREQQQREAAPAPAPDEDLDVLRGDIQRLKQYLQESRRGSGM